MKKYFKLLILIIFMIPTIGVCITKEELDAKFDNIFSDNIVDINAISPQNITDLNYKEAYAEGLIWYMNFEYNLDFQFNEDYTKIYLVDYGEGSRLSNTEPTVISKSKDINWSTFNKNHWNEVFEYLKKNKTRRIMDINYLDFYNKYGRFNKKEEYFSSLNDNEHITFSVNEIETGFGSDEYHDINLLNNIITTIYYDNTIYFSYFNHNIEASNDSLLELLRFQVLYIKDGTEENESSYIKEAQKRLDTYFPNLNPSVKKYNNNQEDSNYKNSSLYFAYNNGIINESLNKSLEPIEVEITLDGNKYYMLVAKGTEEQLNKNIPKSLQNNIDIDTSNSNTSNEDDFITIGESKNDDVVKEQIKENPKTSTFFAMASIVVCIISAACAIIMYIKHQKNINSI